MRRTLAAPWFQLRGIIAPKKGPSREFPIGHGTRVDPARDGELFLFVNDVPWGRGEHSGALEIRVAAWPRGRVPQGRSFLEMRR